MASVWERAAHSVGHMFSLYLTIGFKDGICFLLLQFLVISYLLLSEGSVCDHVNFVKITVGYAW